MAMSLIEEDVSLKPFNTFGLEARARRFARCHTAGEVGVAAAEARHQGWPMLVLGGGSNLLLTRDFPGLVLKVEIGGVELAEATADAYMVKIGAGENWHALVLHALSHGWHGLENLALIPGTVGAAPVQNIGAYGVELDSLFDRLAAVDLASGALIEFDRAGCAFAYRDSHFKHGGRGRYAIVSVTLRLPRNRAPNARYAELRQALAARGIEAPSPRDIADTVIAIRRAKLPDPAEIGNAGSFFKNPLLDGDRFAALKAICPEVVAYPQPDGAWKVAAGWLIDRAGWKGRSRGGAAVFERQALVLVNRGDAVAADVVALAHDIQADIRARYGVELQSEPDWV